MADVNHVMLRNVRLSFPSLFKKDTFEGVEQKYCATLLIPKSDKQIVTNIRNAMKKVQKAKLSADRICLKDGDDVEYEGYEDTYYIKATSNNKPVIIHRDKSQLTADDEVIYAGCYVNAQVSFWWLTHKVGGKRLLANLHVVQFLRDGERFGSGADLEAFEELPDQEPGETPF